MRFQHIDRDSVTAGENQRGGLSIGPVIYESLWSEQKVTGPYGPVIIPCHWPELARRFQKAGGPAGQCLLWRPAPAIFLEINRLEKIIPGKNRNLSNTIPKN